MSHRMCLALAGPGAQFLGQQTTARGPHWLCKYVLPVAPRARQQPSRSDRGRVAHRAENVLPGSAQKRWPAPLRVRWLSGHEPREEEFYPYFSSRGN